MTEYEIGTSDLFLAAAYMALGKTYVRADKANSRKMVFFFVHPEPVEEDEQPMPFDIIEQRWVNGSLLVNAKRYKESIQSLKSVVHTA